MRYFYLTTSDVVIGVGSEEYEDNICVPEDSVLDFRFVSVHGEVICSSDVYEDVLESYKTNLGMGTIRIVYD